MTKNKIFAVVGLGTFGSELCFELANKGSKVIAIDNKSKLVDKIKDSVTQALVMDSTDLESLQNLPIQDIDVVVVAIGDDIEASILTTSLFKKLGVPFIIARAVKDIHAQILKQIGATEIINIETNEGKRLADRLVSPDLLERIHLSKNISVAEILVPKNFVNKKVGELDIRKKYNLNIIAIKRYKTEIDEVGNPIVTDTVIIPNISETLSKGDILILVGTDQKIDSFREV